MNRLFSATPRFLIPAACALLALLMFLVFLVSDQPDMVVHAISFALIVCLASLLVLARSQVALLPPQAKNRHRMKRYPSTSPVADAGWDWNLLTDTVRFGDAWKHMLGYDGHEIGADASEWFQRLHPDDYARVQATMRACLNGETPLYDDTYRLRHKEGTYIQVQARGMLLCDTQGRAWRFVGVHTRHDPPAPVPLAQPAIPMNDQLTPLQTNLDQVQAQLAQIQQLRSNFLQSVSHELRTPLHAIIGFTDALQSLYGATMNDEQRSTLALIEHQGRQLLTSINTMIDLAAMEADNVHLTVSPVPVEQLCRSALRHVEAAANERQITVDFTCPPDMPPLAVDYSYVQHALQHLLSNAAKFTPPGGTIGLNVSLLADIPSDEGTPLVSLTVWDTGKGIDDSQIDIIFEPFTQLDGGLRRSQGGLGLGLAFAQRVAELHCGRLQVVSTPGQGSRFGLLLPVAPPDILL